VISCEGSPRDTSQPSRCRLCLVSLSGTILRLYRQLICECFSSLSGSEPQVTMCSLRWDDSIAVLADCSTWDGLRCARVLEGEKKP